MFVEGVEGQQWTMRLQGVVGGHRRRPPVSSDELLHQLGTSCTNLGRVVDPLGGAHGELAQRGKGLPLRRQ